MAKRKQPQGKWTREEKEDLVRRFLDLQKQGVAIREAAASLGTAAGNLYHWKKQMGMEGGPRQKAGVTSVVKKQPKLPTPYMQLNSTNMPAEQTFTLTKRQLMDLINDLLSMRTGVA